MLPTRSSRSAASGWKAPKPPLERGYWKLYFDHVQQAHQGADLDFLVGKSGAVRAARQPLRGHMLQAADLTIRLHAEDDVVIARVELPPAR